MVVSSFSRSNFSCPCELEKGKPGILRGFTKLMQAASKTISVSLAVQGLALAFSLLTLECFKNLSFQNILPFKNHIQKTY